MIKAVIFDMNGVIINDEHIHELAFKKIVKQYGINMKHKDYVNLCFGRTDKEGFENVGKVYKKNLDLVKAVSEKSNLYMKIFPDNKKVYPGVTDLIKNLNKHFRLALTSSACRKEVNLILREFGLIKYFDVTVSADDVTKGKPDPEPYLLTAKKLFLRPNQCVVIEDSPSGVLSANKAGMRCVGIMTTYKRSDLKQTDKVVDDFDEIFEVLKRWEKESGIIKK
jgi:HAD superfamily hydrolase (TIGR01509 family)